MLDVGDREQLDALVRQRLIGYLQVRKELQSTVPPQNVTALCKDLVEAGRARLWFLGTCACALLAELLFASESGGVWLSQEQAKREKKVLRGGLSRDARRLKESNVGLLKECLRYLRNACFHPAHINPDVGSGKSPVENLADHLGRRGEARVSDELRRRYSLLRDFEVYKVAVRLLDELGRELLATERPPS